MERAQSASLRAVALAPDIPEVLVSQGWILYAGGRYDDAVRLTRAAISRKRDCEGAYYLLLRALFASGKYDEVAALAEEAIEAAGHRLQRLHPDHERARRAGTGRRQAQRPAAAPPGLREPPARGAGGRAGADPAARACTPRRGAPRMPSARRTWRWCCGRTKRPFSTTPPAPSRLSARSAEALDALRKAWDAGFKDADWTRRDPDLAPLHGDPEFEKLYPAPKEES